MATRDKMGLTQCRSLSSAERKESGTWQMSPSMHYSSLKNKTTHIYHPINMMVRFTYGKDKTLSISWYQDVLYELALQATSIIQLHKIKTSHSSPYIELQNVFEEFTNLFDSFIPWLCILQYEAYLLTTLNSKHVIICGTDKFFQ